MHSFNEITQQFEAFLQEKIVFPHEPDGLYAPCRYILEAGGKRIRPALCLMAYEMFGGKAEDALYAAAAYELFHNFTLIHDDIMDNAPLRRGRKTVHEAYDMPTGILSGDVMNIYAYHYLSFVDKAFLCEILNLFNKTAIEVCEGQQLDIDYEKKDKVTVDEYLKMIQLKTSVLLASCLKAGAILANANPEFQNNIYDFGINLGLAFQLQDDYLDAFGEESKTGKQRGGDIKANKKTILLVEAENYDLKSFNKLNSLKTLDDNDLKVSEVLKIYNDLGVANLAKKHIQDFTEKAYQCLSSININEKNKEPLKKLTEMLLGREQ